MGGQHSQNDNLLPSMELMNVIWPGVLASQAVYVVAKFRVADIVAEKPRTVDELAQITNTHSSSLRRVLCSLISLGIFVENNEGEFQNSDFSETLRSSHPESIREWTIMLGAPLFIWKPWGKLEETVITGDPAFNHVFNSLFF